MVTSPSGRDRFDQVGKATGILKLIEHRSPPARQAPPLTRPAWGERDGNMRFDLTPSQQPSPTECYGCVDWFQF
jgi:hypothetical protein